MIGTLSGEGAAAAGELKKITESLQLGIKNLNVCIRFLLTAAGICDKYAVNHH